MQKSIFSFHFILYNILLIFCFFPFLNILNLPIDSQPNALIISFFILIINYKIIINSLPVKILYLILIFFIATFLVLISEFKFETFASYVSYLSLCFVPLAVYISLKRLNGFSFKFFSKIILIWGFVAVVQKIYNPEFLTFLQYRSSGSGLMGRGVNSLAPEPTYYGTIIALFIIIFFINNFNEKRSFFWIILLIVQLVILSLSSTIIAVFLISSFLYFTLEIFKFNFKIKILVYILFTLVITTILFYVNFDVIADTRIYKILEIALANPELILLDESINERLNHALFPIINLYDNNLLPMGFGNFNKYIVNKISSPAFSIFFENINLEHYNKIMSGYGAAFFELGIFGLLIPFFLYSLSKNMLKHKKYVYLFILLNMLLFTSISLNNGLILFVFGNIMYISIEKNKLTKTTN